MIDSSRKEGRFHVGDIVENIVTHKILEVGYVMTDDDDNVIWYDLHYPGSSFDEDGYDLSNQSRSVPPGAFERWKIVLSLHNLPLTM